MDIQDIFVQLRELDLASFETLKNSTNWGPFLTTYYNNKYWASFDYKRF